MPPRQLLLVEDDEAIRSMLAGYLAAQGFAVRAADSGAAALAELHAQPGGIAVLVTDIWLGPASLNGWEIAHTAHAANPAIAVIYLSGGRGADWASKGVPRSRILLKPVRLSAISDAIAVLLQEAAD